MSAAYKKLISIEDSDEEDEEEWGEYDYEAAASFFNFV